MCPLIPDTDTSFCSLPTLCPEIFTKNSNTSSSMCPYKNLMNTGGGKYSVDSFSDFKSYHNCLVGFPMLDILSMSELLGDGLAQ